MLIQINISLRASTNSSARIGFGCNCAELNTHFKLSLCVFD